MSDGTIHLGGRPKDGGPGDVTQDFSQGGANVNTQGNFAASTTPKQAGVENGTYLFDATASNTVSGCRITLNPGDDVAASQRLTNVYPEVKEIELGESIMLRSTVAITDVYIVGIGSTSTSTVGVVAFNESTQATVLGEQVHFYFDSTKNITAIEILLSNGFSSSRYARATVAGYAQ